MEETTLFLAKLIGVYMALVGGMMMVRRRFFMHAVRDFIQDRALRFMIPIIELVAGISMVLVHNIWEGTAAIVITAIAWIMVAESVFYLALPEKTVKRFLTACNRKPVYFIGGLASIAVGVYLIVEGFQIA